MTTARIFHPSIKYFLSLFLLLFLLFFGFSAAHAQADLSISGCAYTDNNHNFQKDADEAQLMGVPVSLYQQKGDDFVLLESQVTEDTGLYRFEHLSAGTYVVVSVTDAQGYFVASVGNAPLSASYTNGMVSDMLTLSDAPLLDQSDIALSTASTLSFTCFHDENSNGLRGKYEMGIAGVTVSVVNGDQVLASALSDEDGVVLLSNVPEGTYCIEVSLPSGYRFTMANEKANANGCQITQSDHAIGTSHPYVFQSGATVTSQAGIATAGSLGGRVFEDVNNNGIMDENEPGIANVSIALVGQKSKESFSVQSDNSGTYLFDGLPSDTYVISCTIPDDKLLARYSSEGGDLRSIFSGDVIEREFTVNSKAQVTNKNIGFIEMGGIHGSAFLDVNYNGLWDEGESGYAGVKVSATRSGSDESISTTTDSNGVYELNGLRSGTYEVYVLLPSDNSLYSVLPETNEGRYNVIANRAGSREGWQNDIELISGEIHTMDVGIAVGASISGTAFTDENYNGILDADEKGISGLAVELLDANGMVVSKTTTIQQGQYTLDGIMPGDYTLSMQRKNEYGFTRYRPEETAGSVILQMVDGKGVSDVMSIVMGDALTHINAGMLPSATVTGSLFDDTNDNGLWDADEMGMVNASVRLHSSDGEFDWVTSVNEQGLYFFDGVMPGDYTLTYQLPEHAVLASIADMGNTQDPHSGLTTQPFVIHAGDAYTHPLVGALSLGTFEALFFHDENANGQMDDNEQPLSGVSVTFTPNTTSKPVTQTTKADGNLLFTELRPASYMITVTLPNGYIFSKSNSDAALTFDTQNEQSLSCAWQRFLLRNQNLIGATKPGSIEGQIWLDENIDEKRSEDETLLAGVSLQLVDESNGTIAAQTISTNKGFHFENVRPGRYTVRFALPEQSKPANDSVSSFESAGATMQQTGIAVKEEQVITGLNAGLFAFTSIHGTALLFEDNSFIPVSGVEVSLLVKGNETPLLQTMTAEDGTYQFDGLLPNDYTLQATLPKGLIFVDASDENFAKTPTVIHNVTDMIGTSDVFSLYMAQHMTATNFLYMKPASIGDQVWLDENQNGLIDGGEPLIPGVTLSLLKDGNVCYETTSNAYGYYQFDAVYPGTYTLQAEAYKELTITTPVPSLRIISSCLVSGDGLLAQSDPFAVQSGVYDANFDLGYCLKEGETLPSAIIPPPGKDWTKTTIVEIK